MRKILAPILAVLLAFASSLLSAQPKQPDFAANLAPREGPQPAPDRLVRQPVSLDINKALDAGVITFSLNGRTSEFKGRFQPPEKNGLQAWVSDRNDAGMLVFVRRPNGSVFGQLTVGTTTFFYTGIGASGELRQMPRVIGQP